MTALPDVVVSLASGVDPEISDELLALARQEQLTTAVEEREPEVYAGMEWFLPTAVVLWLADKYFGGMLEEAGKDHYQALRQVWQRLVRRTTGPERDVRPLAIVSGATPEKVKDHELPALSVYCLLRTGQRVKFVYEQSLDDTAQQPAIDSMLGLMARHYASIEGGDLVADLIVQGVAQDGMVILRFDSGQRRWLAWNPRATRG